SQGVLAPTRLIGYDRRMLAGKLVEDPFCKELAVQLENNLGTDGGQQPRGQECHDRSSDQEIAKYRRVRPGEGWPRLSQEPRHRVPDQLSDGLSAKRPFAVGLRRQTTDLLCD